MADPHFIGRNMLVTVERPVVERRSTISGIPLKMKEAHAYRRRAQMAGEYHEDILRELGLPAARILRLQQEQAVG